MKEHVLIVEDDTDIAEMVSLNLGVTGYVCSCAYTGTEALDLITKASYDIALLDIMLPGIDGFSLMPCLKNKGIPVIYVTAKNALEDKIRGLRMGAEDYIVKPFEMLELIVRIEKVLSRNKAGNTSLTFLNVEMDLENRSVFLDGAEVALTPMEYGLLRELLLHPKMTHTRERLLNLV